MSIEESNKLRAKLGLKPLNIGGGAAKDAEEEDDGTKEGSLIPGSDVRHLPAVNLTEKTHIEKMREKLQQKRQKRLVESKLLNVKTLGESDSEEVSSKPVLSHVNPSVIFTGKLRSLPWSSVEGLHSGIFQTCV
jgi:hypothetical protein